jgi:hypothetical protein
VSLDGALRQVEQLGDEFNAAPVCAQDADRGAQLLGRLMAWTTALA